MYVTCSCDTADLAGYVHPKFADNFDGTFPLVCEDTGEILRVNGWLFYDITVKEPAPFEMSEPEKINTVYQAFLQRRTHAGALGYARELGDGRIRIVTDNVKVEVSIVPSGWAVAHGDIVGIDASLETAARFALSQ